MPAYNAAKTLGMTYHKIPREVVDDVILVDDASRDETVRMARALGMKTHVHACNKGYGGNQKTCYALALREGAQIVVMIHPDYQYDPGHTGALIEPILNGQYHIMLGSRIRNRHEALAGGMPLYKYLGNRLLTLAENIILGENLSEYHTGFQAFDRRVLMRLPLEYFSDDFVFDQQILIAALREGFRIGEIAVPISYFPEASSINLRRSVVYGLKTLEALILYKLDAWGLYTSAIFARGNV